MLTGHMHKLIDSLYNKKWGEVETRSSIVIGGFTLGVLTSLVFFDKFRSVWGRMLGISYTLTMLKAEEKGAWAVRNND